MSEAERDAARVDERAHLLPEERAAGSDDPEAQAAQILAESDERVDDRSGTRVVSEQTPGFDEPEVGRPESGGPRSVSR